MNTLRQIRVSLVEVAMIIVLIGAGMLYLAYRPPIVVDDAPITYRYAENLAHGLGFVYNAGEQIIGTTTPLYTLILAVLRVIGFSIPGASQVIGFSSSLATIYLIFLLGRKLDSPFVGLLAALLVALNWWSIIFAMGGMETPLYALLIVAALYSYDPERPTAGIILAALCVWMRLDGAIVGAALLGSAALSRRRIPWRQAALYALLIMPWFVFSLLYTGSVFPHSLTGKQGHAAARLLFSWENMWIWNRTFFDEPFSRLILIPLSAPLIIGQNKTQYQKWQPLLLWFGGYLVAYFVVRIEEYQWYLVPPTIILCLFIALGAKALIGLAAEAAAHAPNQSSQARSFMRGGLVVFLVMNFYNGLNVRVQGYNDYLNDFESARLQIGDWAAQRPNICPSMYIGAIGHIGYQALNTYILDGAGLVSNLPADETTLQARLQTRQIACYVGINGWNGQTAFDPAEKDWFLNTFSLALSVPINNTPYQYELWTRIDNLKKGYSTWYERQNNLDTLPSPHQIESTPLVWAGGAPLNDVRPTNWEVFGVSFDALLIHPYYEGIPAEVPMTVSTLLRPEWAGKRLVFLAAMAPWAKERQSDGVSLNLDFGADQPLAVSRPVLIDPQAEDWTLIIVEVPQEIRGKVLRVTVTPGKDPFNDHTLIAFIGVVSNP